MLGLSYVPWYSHGLQFSVLGRCHQKAMRFAGGMEEGLIAMFLTAAMRLTAVCLTDFTCLLFACLQPWAWCASWLCWWPPSCPILHFRWVYHYALLSDIRRGATFVHHAKLDWSAKDSHRVRVRGAC